MAGVTSEAKAASERLPGRISIGVLAMTFPAELLDEVIDAEGVREVRSRLLPARLMMFPLRPGRSAPRARKRGGSTRYPRRKPDIAPVRNVTHTIVMHPLQPKPT